MWALAVSRIGFHCLQIGQIYFYLFAQSEFTIIQIVGHIKRYRIYARSSFHEERNFLNLENV
mgnify:CR=1 FL=1